MKEDEVRSEVSSDLLLTVAWVMRIADRGVPPIADGVEENLVMKEQYALLSGQNKTAPGFIRFILFRSTCMGSRMIL